MHIGTKVKDLRKRQGLNLSQLAEKSGVQIATLSRIENNKMTGTLESHLAIAAALGVDITQLYAGLLEDGYQAELRKETASTDVFVHSDKSSYEILTGRLMSKKMMPILLKIEPGGATSREQNVRGAEKFVYILEGALEVNIAGETYLLERGNTLYFDAAKEHYFKNPGTVTARAVCVGTPVTL